VVVADRDGVAVIPAGSFADVLERSRARGLKETQFLERIRAGESTVDLYDLRRT
jgi:4-hydroxy-4-methyl-2-oxoglutarate aldolase